mmetsp:Transcript_68703/g.114186  ORF Transcript_68703/g.114186 Transcript_68703/m.114186 type:complete len:414 (+) Transcript_68703:223-1464(+)
MSISAIVDDALSYTTLKRVVIRDRLAGSMFYFICLSVLAYIFIYEFYYQKQYLAMQELTGAVRVSMSTPAAGHRTEPVSLSYCSQHEYKHGPQTFLRKPCIDSGYDVTHFSRDQPGIGCMIGTRVTAKPQMRNATCPDSWAHAATCAPWVTEGNASWSTYFVADIESSSILIQHTVTVSSWHSSFHSVASSFGTERKANATMTGPGHLSPITLDMLPGGDKVLVRDLLAVANVSLDEPTAAYELNNGQGQAGCTTRRFQGATILIEVQYDPLVAGHYSYTVREVNLEAKLQYGDWEGPNRVRIDLHGIQLITKQSGGLDIFDYKTCALALISSLVLLSTASKITDYFLIYTSCLPGCKDYATHIYEQTPHLSPRSQSGRARLESLLSSKRQEQADMRDLDWSQRQDETVAAPG